MRARLKAALDAAGIGWPEPAAAAAAPSPSPSPTPHAGNG
jgi:hypothetical protein